MGEQHVPTLDMLQLKAADKTPADGSMTISSHWNVRSWHDSGAQHCTPERCAALHTDIA
jgi:hypothetical protein